MKALAICLIVAVVAQLVNFVIYEFMPNSDLKDKIQKSLFITTVTGCALALIMPIIQVAFFK